LIVLSCSREALMKSEIIAQLGQTDILLPSSSRMDRPPTVGYTRIRRKSLCLVTAAAVSAFIAKTA
jgi:hypothetical protein